MISEISTSNRAAAMEPLREDQPNTQPLQDMCFHLFLKAVLTPSSTFSQSLEKKFLPPGYFSALVYRIPDFAVKELADQEEAYFFCERCMMNAVDIFNEVVRIFSRSVKEETASQFTEAFREKFGCSPPLDRRYSSYADAAYLVVVNRIKSPQMYRSHCLALANYRDIPLFPEIVYSRSDYESQWGGGINFYQWEIP